MEMETAKTSRPSTAITVVAIAMVAGGLAAWHLIRNINAANTTALPTSTLPAVKPAAPSLPPLHQAAADNKPDAVSRLAAQGADVDAKDFRGRTPLMTAAAAGHLAAVQALLSAGASVSETDTLGATALWLAAGAPGDASLITTLLEAGATADTPGPEGITPLMQAARAGNPEKVIALLNAGAAPDAKSQAGLTARDFAQKRRDDGGRQIAAVLGEP